MKGKKLFRALRNIDPQLILDAAPDQKQRIWNHAWIKWGALAACLCLVVVAAVLLLLPESPASPFPHKHVFGEWETVKEASCSAQGEEVRVCSCGEQENRYTALLPHFAGEWIVEKEPTIKLPTPDDPDEREPGIKCQFCERCGAKLDEELIPATGSLGLAYAMNPDGKTFSVAGIGNCIDKDIVIPENFCGYHVVSISDGAFKECNFIQTVTLPETITTIGKEAFFGCIILRTVVLNEGLLEIGEKAFSSSTTLENITIPSTVNKIGEGAFMHCYRIAEVVIPEGVTVLGNHTFQLCWSLKSVTLPTGLISIGEFAFGECAFSEITIPASVQSIGKSAFYRCSKLESIVLPDGLSKIENATFSECTNLKSITIPESVTEIGYQAFQYAGLEEIVIPSGVTVIHNYTFEECKNLKSVTLPEGLESIGVFAFCDCTNLENIQIPDNIKEIDAHAFGSCDKLIEVENGVHYVGKWAVGCDRDVVSVVLREDTVGIANSAFATANSLKNITLPNGLKYIGEYALLIGYTLEEIIYDGSELEWASVQKGDNWYNDYSCTIVFTKMSNE